MSPANDCEKELETLKTYKASINQFLASLAQRVAYIEILASSWWLQEVVETDIVSSPS